MPTSKKKTESENDRLMREMGSDKGSDPIPPDQYLYFRADRNVLQRFLAFVRSRTIRYGYRRPWVGDTTGRPLTLTEVAHHCKCDIRNLTTVVSEADRIGLIKVDRKPFRITLCGNVTTPPIESITYPQNVMPRHDFPSYVVRQIQAWEKERREAFKVEYMSLIEEGRKMRAELESIERKNENTLFLKWGIEKKRRNREQPDEQKEKGEQKALMPGLPKSDTRGMTFLEPILNGNPPPSKALPQNGKPGALTEGILQRKKNTSLSSSSTDLPSKTATTTNGGNQPSTPTVEVLQVLEALRKYAPCDLEPAQSIVDRCRKEDATCTPRAILEAIRVKGVLLNGRQNKIGFLVTAVPKLFAHGGAATLENPLPDRMPTRSEQKAEEFAREYNERKRKAQNA